MMRENNRKTRVGVVVSSKMEKTAVVRIEKRVKHEKYKKIIVSVLKVKAHNINNEAKEGDKVLISESRPLSKEKRWHIVSIIERDVQK